MLACLLTKWPTMRFIKGALPACLAWAATYQLIGILGGSLFAEPWEGVVAAVALTVLISGSPAIWRKLRARGKGADADGSAGRDGTGAPEGPTGRPTAADGPSESDGQQA